MYHREGVTTGKEVAQGRGYHREGVSTGKEVPQGRYHREGCTIWKQVPQGKRYHREGISTSKEVPQGTDYHREEGNAGCTAVTSSKACTAVAYMVIRASSTAASPSACAQSCPALSCIKLLSLLNNASIGSMRHLSPREVVL